MDTMKYLTPEEVRQLSDEFGRRSFERSCEFLSNNMNISTEPRGAREAKTHLSRVLNEAEEGLTVITRDGESFAVVALAKFVRLTCQLTASPTMADVLQEVRGAPTMGRNVRMTYRGGSRSHARLPEAVGEISLGDESVSR